MAVSPKEKEIETFRKYIADKKIMICDPGASSRSGLFRIFQDLGAQTHNIVLVNTYQQASTQIVAVKPHIVAAEYDLGKRSGLDLLQEQRAQRPTETKSSVFIVVTGNTSQSAVARAAEEDIDAFIIKPFTPEVVRNTIMKAALMKVRPPEYLVTIDKGKAAMEANDLDGAEKLFIEATGMDPQPSLALYYLGKLKYYREMVDQARGSYSKGLEFNKIHYKCLVGLYDLLMSKKAHHEAYEVVKKLSQYFPANPKRLSEVLRLAIINGKYEDVEKYYAVFVNIDEREETLIKYICAALVVCGKHYLATNSRSRAMELFKKAAATGTGRAKILREICQALVDANLPKEAKPYLEKFPPDSMKSPEYLISHFQVANTELPAGKVIDLGRKLIAANTADEHVYEIVLHRSIEAKLKAAAQDLYDEAMKKYPNAKKRFAPYLDGINSL